MEHGFEEQELKDIKHRSVLYHATIFMGLVTVVFSSLAVAAWT
jgi:hypothetical protein